MSKPARALILGATLAAMNLAGMTAVAQAHTTAGDHDARRPPTERQVGESYRHRAVASSITGSPNAIEHAIAQQHAASATTDAAIQAGLSQERYYSTWGYGDTPASVPAEPSGQPGWLVLALSVLAAILALSTGLAVMAARRASRKVPAGQAG
jgi:hypothetical protein